MAKKKAYQIDPQEKDYADHFGRRMEAISIAFEKSRQFKLGDYLIRQITDDDGIEPTSGWRQDVNSYGVPKKYEVVYVTNNGVPFVKEVNSAGRYVSGAVEGIISDDERWDLDPAYADSILLGENYDPAVASSARKTMFKEITEHNKRVKIDTRETARISTFLNTVTVGQVVWTSNKNWFTVDAILNVPLKEALRHTGRRRLYGSQKGKYLILQVRDHKNRSKHICNDDLLFKAIYSERPRTYRELNT